MESLVDNCLPMKKSRLVQTGERAPRLYLPPRETRVAQASSKEEQVENNRYLLTFVHCYRR